MCFFCKETPSSAHTTTRSLYHRRTKRKYRALAINGFTPEHLHVGRLAGRGSE
ncbi:hypothetical protein ALC60_05679 [Trachymyrmex zeteki]|uniref:Uncharacterized protein n=1 Tax=Mycetomoellerius zeteki TaxID=64791 RepID=A0A151X4X6_9HYME|nr:hypothetical protein ALC60_05679 [Trachymyrmex zeteki]